MMWIILCWVYLYFWPLLTNTVVGGRVRKELAGMLAPEQGLLAHPIPLYTSLPIVIIL